MATVLVLEPIFEADLEPEQYGYRPGRSALDAVRQVERLVRSLSLPNCLYSRSGGERHQDRTQVNRNEILTKYSSHFAPAA